MKVSIKDYQTIKKLLRKYYQSEIDSIKLGDYLLKDNYSKKVDEITNNIRKEFISSIEGMFMCYKNDMLLENRIAHNIEKCRKLRHDTESVMLNN